MHYLFNPDNQKCEQMQWRHHFTCGHPSVLGYIVVAEQRSSLKHVKKLKRGCSSNGKVCTMPGEGAKQTNTTWQHIPCLVRRSRLRSRSSSAVWNQQLPVKRITITHTIVVHTLQHLRPQKIVVGLPVVVQLLQLLEEFAELWPRQRIQQPFMVALQFQTSDLGAVVHGSPRELTARELHKHVEERHEVVVSTQVLRWREKKQIKNMPCKLFLGDFLNYF